MNSNNFKDIKFIYESNEFTVNVNTLAPLEDMNANLRTYCNLESDVPIVFINADTQAVFIPVSIMDFWFNTEGVPRYRIKINECKNFYTINPSNTPSFETKIKIKMKIIFNYVYITYLDGRINGERHWFRKFANNYILPFFRKYLPEK